VAHKGEPWRDDAGQNRQWILNARPSGRLTGEEFRWNVASVPRPAEGQMGKGLHDLADLNHRDVGVAQQPGPLTGIE
jgi:hypothetical protein